MSTVKVRLQNHSCSGVAGIREVGYLPPYSTGEKARIVELPAARVMDILAKLKKQVPSHVVVEIMPEENEPALTAESPLTGLPPETPGTKQKVQGKKSPLQKENPSKRGKP
jgi:hypothetical protein